MSLYMISSIGGVLFSSVLSPSDNSVGASTAIFGMIGYYIGFMFINWDTLGENNPAKRMSLGIFTVIILIINIEIGTAVPSVDWMGHLGGMLVGLIMAFCLCN